MVKSVELKSVDFGLIRYSYIFIAVLVLTRVKMVKGAGGDLGEAIAGILLGIAGGIALGALLEYLFGEKCPHCKKPIKKNAVRCPHCGNYLSWGLLK